MARSPSSGVPLLYREEDSIHQPFLEYNNAYDRGYRDAGLSLTLIGIVLTTARQDTALLNKGRIVIASSRTMCDVPAQMQMRDIAYVDGYAYALREAFARRGWHITARMIDGSVEQEITAQRELSDMVIALAWHALNSLRKLVFRGRDTSLPPGSDT